MGENEETSNLSPIPKVIRRKKRKEREMGGEKEGWGGGFKQPEGLKQVLHWKLKIHLRQLGVFVW